MKKITTIAELREALENSNYNYYGLRGATEHDIEIVNSGRDYLDCSYDLSCRRDCDYDETAEQLNGTCAIEVDAFWMNDDALAERYNEAKGYANNHHCTDIVYLIADKNGESGEDENEIILGNGYGADVIAIVEL